MTNSTMTTWWQGLAGRERRAIGLAAAVLLLAMLWQVAIGPAWRTLREAPARNAHAKAQLQRMLAQAEWSKQMQATVAPPLNRSGTLLALEAATQASLADHARTEVLPDRVRVTVEGVEPATLASWLQQVRSKAALLPQEADLTRDGADARWTGSLTLTSDGLLRP